MHNIFFNAHHSPLGAFASFTLGFPGAAGGLGLELGKPADQNVYIGIESGTKDVFQTLPFYAGCGDERARYEVGQPGAAPATGIRLEPFPRAEIRREFNLGTDTWQAGDLTFTIYSQTEPVPDPERAQADELKAVLMPAVLAELTLDNRQGQIPRRAFFGFQGTDPYTAMRRFDPAQTPGLAGVAQGRHSAIATREAGIRAGLAFTPEELLAQNEKAEFRFDLGSLGGLIFTVAPGMKRTCRFAICFYRGGFVTAGQDASYLYTKYFSNVEQVAEFGLEHFERYRELARAADERLAKTPLSEEQRTMLALAVRSYYGSSELLDVQGRPFWIINEGEYRMINTLDLTVDHLFYEVQMNPWTLRNVLDRYADRHAYEDRVRFPGDPTEHPGGISFAHDMGVANSLAHPGFSVYERLGTDGCFSFMTHEQLVNWICCAAVYAARTGDEAWLSRRLPTLQACLRSMQQRDHPDPAQRNGVMGLDSSRTQGGAEITTYDCHDVSLRQARNNLYLAVKCWAAYVLLERIFQTHALPDLALQAGAQAERCAATLVKHQQPEGFLPAILPEGGEAINRAMIIPAVEGLVFPYLTGQTEALREDGRFGPLVRALKRHLETILVPGACLFPDGGWKLTSAHDNSWPSKSYLCQFVARRILGLPWDETGRAADRAMLNWLTNPETAYWDWSDQMVNGQARGARYYPRGVTSSLWLLET